MSVVQGNGQESRGSLSGFFPISALGCGMEAEVEVNAEVGVDVEIDVEVGVGVVAEAEVEVKDVVDAGEFEFFPFVSASRVGVLIDSGFGD